MKKETYVVYISNKFGTHFTFSTKSACEEIYNWRVNFLTKIQNNVDIEEEFYIDSLENFNKDLIKFINIDNIQKFISKNSIPIEFNIDIHNVYRIKTYVSNNFKIEDVINISEIDNLHTLLINDENYTDEFKNRKLISERKKKMEYLEGLE